MRDTPSLLDDPRDLSLLLALQEGLPLVRRPYAVLGSASGHSEGEVLERLAAWQASGLIRRFGVIVRHRRLGYRANAMVVWEVPESRVADCGQRLSREDCVSLCYRRPPRPPLWPYNLFCMIHGRERSRVEAQIERVTARCGLSGLPRAILFSRHCFKQRGAHYAVNHPLLADSNPPRLLHDGN